MSCTMDEARKQKACYYNDGVDCEKRNCGKCGWNPAVFERRKAETRERIKQEYGAREVIRIRRFSHEGNL